MDGAMADDLRTRLDDARLYLCTDARRSRGDLVPFLDAVLGAGVDIVQLREKGLEARGGARAARGVRRRVPTARPPAGGERPGRRRSRGGRRRPAPGPGRPAGTGRAAHPGARAGDRAEQPQPGPGGRGRRRARRRLLLRRAGLDDADQAGPPGDRPQACWVTWRGRRPPGPGSRSAGSAWTGSTRCSPPGPPGWSSSGPSPRPTTRPPPRDRSPGGYARGGIGGRAAPPAPGDRGGRPPGAST